VLFRSFDIDEAQVIGWLKRHPDLLDRYPELCEVLLPPGQRRGDGQNVVELQRFMVQKLQGELSLASNVGMEILDASRQNMSAQQRVHNAVLALMEATSFEHLVHIATQDWTDLLDVDVVSICIEGDARRLHGLTAGNVYVLAPGSIDRLFGGPVHSLLRADSGRAEALYGPAANLVRSDALARLYFGPGTPQGLLAIGSRAGDKFHPNQGTELFIFLARMLEASVRAWLSRAR
jgi:uncharacterized protein YigA (DUF484 family)